MYRRPQFMSLKKLDIENIDTTHQYYISKGAISEY